MKGDEMRVNVLSRLLIPLGIYFVVSIVLVAIVGQSAIEKIKAKVFMDANRHLHQIYKEKMNEQKAARAIGALTLASDGLIKRALLLNRPKIAFDEIIELSNSYKTFTKFKDISIFVFSKDFKLFTENSRISTHHSNFLKPLEWVKKNKKLLVTFDVASDGLKLRGIAPVIKNHRYIGSVEFNGGIDGAIKDLKKDGIYLITLLNEKKFHSVQTKSHYNKQLYEVLQKRFDSFKNRSFEFVDGFYIVKIPIKNYANEIVGNAFIAERNETIQHLIKINENSMIKILTLLGVLAVILAVVFYFTVNKVVINPLSKLRRVLTSNASMSDGEKGERIDITTDDEFGDITQIVNDNMQKREDMYEEILELLRIIDENVLILKIDKEANIIEATKRFLKESGYSLDELTKMKITDLMLDEEVKKELLEALKEESGIEKEAALRTKDGHLMWIRFVLTKQCLKNKSVCKFVVLSYDITDKKEIEDLNKNLENRVLERTLHLSRAKEEIEELNKQIKQSIEYALLIQKAILIEEKILKERFKDAFIIWEPRDIVSGDVYFFIEVSKNECLVMVVDCTSHGVPGALVTMVVKAIEREIVTKIQDKELEASPSKILQFFNKEIKGLFAQIDKYSASKINVGFDGGVLYFNREENIIKFAGANTPLFMIRNGELNEIKGDRQSVGYKINDFNYQYKEYTISLQTNDRFYITTDGAFDQLGGDKKLPFGKKRFKEIISKDMPLSKQKEFIMRELDRYRGEEEQTDDITVVGLEV
ncbi:MAG: SpoIIE family protein phosphatase [Epsilonproteobacteria bacterium]|nr:SpoIIE family protein phosphatase [Campylobacterota bacterium]